MEVYVYYTENYGDLIGDGFNACENMCVFSNLEVAKQQVISTIKLHAGITESGDGYNHFVVSTDELRDAGININDGDKLTDEQITQLVEYTFKDDGGGILLFADEQDNYEEYFIVRVYPHAVIDEREVNVPC